MYFIYFIYLIGSVVSIVIPVLLVLFIVKKIREANPDFPGGGPNPPFGGAGLGQWLQEVQVLHQQQLIDENYMRTMQEIHALVRQAQMQQGQGLPPSAHLGNANVNAQLEAKIAQANREMAHFDQMSRERLEMSRAGMMSDAAAAGIDVSSWGPM